MLDYTVNQILQRIEETPEAYYKLVILVAPPKAKHTIDYEQMANQAQAKMINVNLALSQSMLSLTPRQRALKAATLLGTIVKNAPSNTVLLNNIHILFDPLLRQDPLRLLQNLSRHKTIIAVWEGQVQEQYLAYASPDHPEYRRYPTRDLVIISPVSTL